MKLLECGTVRQLTKTKFVFLKYFVKVLILEIASLGSTRKSKGKQTFTVLKIRRKSKPDKSKQGRYYLKLFFVRELAESDGQTNIIITKYLRSPQTLVV